MPSSIWKQASNVWARASLSARAVHSARVERRFFVVLSARHDVALSRLSTVLSRRGSSLQSALRANPDPDTYTTSVDIDVVKTEDALPPFSSLKSAVSYETLKAIIDKPFQLTHMSPVQAEVLPLLPGLAEPYKTDSPDDGSPRDLLVRAKTGTGKTMAFLVPAVEARIKAIDAFGKTSARNAGTASDKNFVARARRVFAHEHVGTLVISPTRELATQIANEAMRLTRHHDGFEVRLLTGGASKRLQMRDWMRGRRDIVVATPGRLRDLLQTEPEVVHGISKTQLLILDEADTLLDMGFRDDIDAIKAFLPPVPERQTFLFSATVSRAIQQVARSTLASNHKYINCVTESSSPVHAHVDQYHTVLPSAGYQIPHILRLIAHDQLSNPGHSKILVFLPTTKMTQLFATLIRELSQATFPAGRNTRVYEIHSKRTQESRTSTSESFRRDKSGASVLVTSDVSARGVDYPGVTRVIQVGIPATTEQYVHRVGRTGRAGTQGRGDLVLLPWEMGFVTWQLTEVSLKPLTVQELVAQVMDLGTKFDEDPAGFFVNAPISSAGGSRQARGRPTVTGPKMFTAPTTAILQNIERSSGEILAKLDEEAVRETFMSLLGYYMAKTAELRVPKSEVVQGCRSWSVDACGLPTPPFVSENFLEKLGYSDARTRYVGRVPRERRSSESQVRNSWEGRGRQSVRRREMPSWMVRNPMNEESDSGDMRGSRSSRYEKKADSGRGYEDDRNRGGYSGKDRGGNSYGNGSEYTRDRVSDGRAGYERFENGREGRRKDAGGSGYGIKR